MTIQINTPGGLIASLPPLMGFVPQESVVPIVFDSMGHIKSIMRLDRDAPEEAYLHLQGVLESTEDAYHLIVLVVGPSPNTDEFPLEYILQLYAGKFKESKSGIQIFAVPRLTAGAPVLEVFVDGTFSLQGELQDWKETEIAAENILRGGATVEDNEMGVIAMFLQQLPPEPDTYCGKDVKAWVRSAFEDDLRPSNKTVWMWLEESVDNRDWIIGQIPNDPGRTFSEFAAVARASGGLGREQALTIAGLAAYCRGKGAHAQVALTLAKHEAHERGDQAMMAALALSMLQSGVHPEEIRDVCKRVADEESAL